MRHVGRRSDAERGSTWGRGEHRWDGDGDDEPETEFDRSTQAGGAGWVGPEYDREQRENERRGFDPSQGRGGVYGPRSGYAVPGTPDSQSHYPHRDWSQREMSTGFGRWWDHWPTTPPNYNTQGTQGGYAYGPSHSPYPGYGVGDRSSERWGPFSGRGPKGYRRSDARIHEDVCERLTQDGELDASEIDVRVEEGDVVLSGSVRDRDSKRLAEDLAQECTGVRDVRNELRVASAEDRFRPHEGMTTTGTRKSARRG